MYKKRHLVPFGEYMPMREVFMFFLPFLGEISILDREMTPGDSPAVYSADGIGKIGSVICFDSIFEEVSLDAVREGAELIVLGTNDSWFKDSLGIYMHRNQARLRSIEVGRCTVRAACTGVSSIINNVGENFDEVAVFEKDFALGEVYVTDTDTLYTVIGNLFVYMSAIVVLALFSIEYYKHIKKSRS